MQLGKIYALDIERTINPAVVVSNKRQETIDAEIEEYVFTDDLIQELYKILDTVVNKKEGKTGIWINGYYGSGKSHFIKFAHYCLSEKTREKAFKKFNKAVNDYDSSKVGANFNITPSNIALLEKKIAAASFDNIMFNVEDETDDGSGERMTRIFLNMFNRFRGYNSKNIALAILFEKYLDEKGKFEEFKSIVKSKLNYDWERDAAEVAVYELSNVLEIAKELVPEMDPVSMHSNLANPDAIKIGIKATLIPELQKFLETKDKNYRLLFLVDEVSQYVGNNKEILLNFQNIIERVSDDCNNQVWIACTAQQTLDDVSIGTLDATSANDEDAVKDEFGKILGRFDTRISLQSSDASYITQKRVLSKDSKGAEILSKLYHKNTDYILNQFKINHELFKGYQSEDDFELAYPFVPYQFKLISHVFEAFQQLGFVVKEVKDNERSVLGITHFTARMNAKKEVGYFIPFDAFYNGQFHTNLTHRGSRAIQNGLELPYVKENPFADRVVKVLFMISNLLENQRQTFPSNVDNLTILLMTKLDENKMELQNKIRDVLDKLVEASIIRKDEKDNYFFFNEDEIDVQNLIKNKSISLDYRLEEFDKIFRKETALRNKFSFGSNDFKVGYFVEGKEFFRGGDFPILVLLNDTTDIAKKALDLPKSQLGICINEWFTKDKQLRNDFEWFCKTRKFFSDNTDDNSGGVRAKTIENFRIRNDQLQKSIIARFKSKYPETRFISQQRIIESDQISGSSSSERTKNVIEKHLKGIYKNHHLSGSYAKNTQELKKSAANRQKVLDFNLSPAEVLVNDKITAYGNQMNVQDLIKEFEKPPFGWRDEALLDVLVHLVQKKKRELKYRNQPRYPVVDFIAKAVSKPERLVCEVYQGEEIDQSTLDETFASYKVIFNNELPATTDGNELFSTLKSELDKKLSEYELLEEKYYIKYPFGNCFNDTVKKLKKWGNERDPKSLFTALNEEKENAQKLLDLTKGIADFAENNVKNYDAIKKFHQSNGDNFLELDPDAQEKVEKIDAFLRMDDPRREYRHIRKAYEEVKKALSDYRDKMQADVVKDYEKIFDDLEKEKSKQGVTEANVYADRNRIINDLKRMVSIAQLRNKQLEASNFKAEQIRSLIQYAAQNTSTTSGVAVNEPEIYYITKVIATISDEKELDEYLTRIRKEMQGLLDKNKTIILK